VAGGVCGAVWCVGGVVYCYVVSGVVGGAVQCCRWCSVMCGVVSGVVWCDVK
jgi:hypothetical protein